MVQGGNRDGNFVLTLGDKWASHYASEQTVLKLILKKDLSNWFDTVILEKEVSFPAAGSYAVDFLAYAKEFSQKLKAGKNYYVEYSFKRVGKISKPDLMKVGETDKAAYQPASLAAAF